MNKIEPINNISKEKLEPGTKVENWVLVVRCRRDMVQKVVVLPIMILLLVNPYYFAISFMFVSHKTKLRSLHLHLGYS